MSSLRPPAMSSVRPPAMGSIPPPPGPVEAIVRVLAPFLGEHMARAAVRTHAEKMGLGVRPPTPTEVEDLLDRLLTGLIVFVGRPKAERILADARIAARAAGGRP